MHESRGPKISIALTITFMNKHREVQKPAKPPNALMNKEVQIYNGSTGRGQSVVQN